MVTVVGTGKCWDNPDILRPTDLDRRTAIGLVSLTAFAAWPASVVHDYRSVPSLTPDHRRFPRKTPCIELPDYRIVTDCYNNALN